jgi:hypothetical protein
MNINSLDLNLLVAFVAIDRERNITLAADRVGLSQPALSNALARLRKILNDPLFVRTVRGMEPTPYAASIAEPIRKACELIDGALKMDASFDAARSSRTFSIFMTDIGEAVMLPRLLRHLQTIAPGVCIHIESIPAACAGVLGWHRARRGSGTDDRQAAHETFGHDDRAPHPDAAGGDFPDRYDRDRAAESRAVVCPFGKHQAVEVDLQASDDRHQATLARALSLRSRQPMVEKRLPRAFPWPQTAKNLACHNNK